MSLFQIIALSLFVWFGYKQFAKFKGAPAIKILYQLRWFFITLSAVLLVGDPRISSVVAQKLGIGRGVDVVIYFALIWLLYQNYNQTQEIEKLYDKLDKLVRQIALKGDYDGSNTKENIGNSKKTQSKS